MCERKPGPRCSPDSRVVLQKLSGEYQALKKQVKDAEIVYERLLVKIDDTHYDAYYELDSVSEENRYFDMEASKVKVKLDKANLIYDATPDGLDSLKKLAAVSGNAKTIKNIRTPWMYVGFNGESDDEPSIDLALSKKGLIENRSDIAQQHRDWQAKASQLLAEKEKESLAKALFTADLLKNQVEQEEQDDRKRLAKLDREENELFWDWNSSGKFDVDGRAAKMAENQLKQNRIGLRMDYRVIRLDDLESYKKNIEKKQENMLKENNNTVQDVQDKMNEMFATTP